MVCNMFIFIKIGDSEFFHKHIANVPFWYSGILNIAVWTILRHCTLYVYNLSRCFRLSKSLRFLINFSFSFSNSFFWDLVCKAKKKGKKISLPTHQVILKYICLVMKIRNLKLFSLLRVSM